MDLNNPVIQQCVAGCAAEFAHQVEQARACYQLAWELAATPFEKCIAAHYVARFQDTPEDTLRWNQCALEQAEQAAEPETATFYHSLYLNLAHSHELLGHPEEARNYRALAQACQPQ